MDFNTITNDLLQLFEMGLNVNDLPKSLIMNKGTCELILKTDPIPSSITVDGNPTIFGMPVLYASHFPINVIAILQRDIAIGYMLSIVSNPKKAAEERTAIEQAMCEGSFIYNDIQFIGLSEANLPLWSERLKNNIPPMWQPTWQSGLSQVERSTEETNRSNTIQRLIERLDQFKQDNMVYVANQFTIHDIYKANIPQTDLVPLLSKMNGTRIIVIDYVPNGIIGLMDEKKAMSLFLTFTNNLALGNKFNAIIAYNASEDLFYHDGDPFVKLIKND